jgi:putative nucleotidyltransferase with HDIG domain
LIVDADREAMHKALPELDLIEDQALRSRVLDTLTALWRDSDWEDLESVPYLTDFPEISWVQHTRFVAAATAAAVDVYVRLLDRPLDRDLAVAAALLHDGSKFQEYERTADGYGKSELGRKLQHSAYAAHVALNHGLPLDLVHLIASHTPMSFVNPQRPEGWIVREADAMMLEALVNKTSHQYVAGYYRGH